MEESYLVLPGSCNIHRPPLSAASTFPSVAVAKSTGGLPTVGGAWSQHTSSIGEAQEQAHLGTALAPFTL